MRIETMTRKNDDTPKNKIVNEILEQYNPTTVEDM